MTDRQPADDAERLRARLGGVDPAAHLPPATPHEVSRLLEETMSHPTDRPDQSEHPGRRGRLTWLAAAAAVAVVAGGAAVATMGGDDETPTAQEPTTSSSPEVTPQPSTPPAAEPGSVTELAISDPGTAKCLMPNAEVLRGQELAFEGVVTSVEGDTVTLEPTTWFRGTPTETVEVTAPPKELRHVLVAVDFAEGERYLVSTFGGEVTLCGFSDAWSPELAELYAEAYANG